MRHTQEPVGSEGDGSSAPPDVLDALEAESVYILREAFNRLDKLAMLWSVGKDSNVLLWLTRKAFFGHVPFPVIHIDTSYKIPEMIAFRDRLVKEWGLDLIIGRNEVALAAGMNHKKGRVVCCTALKTEALKRVIGEHGFTGVIAGIRRDEEGTRAKERVFSPRGEKAEWNFRDQPPEFWDQYKTDFPPGTHLRVHPLLHWTELDVWRYIRREAIPVVELYFAKRGQRYRSLGCLPCTGTIKSEAVNLDGIIRELESTLVSERSGRAQDREAEDAFERLRADGYM
ncbi:MAG: sulfate adenylyltransferase subunit CysD [Alphaproteobacteria bacterium]